MLCNGIYPLALQWDISSCSEIGHISCFLIIKIVFNRRSEDKPNKKDKSSKKDKKSSHSTKTRKSKKKDKERSSKKRKFVIEEGELEEGETTWENDDLMPQKDHTEFIDGKKSDDLTNLEEGEDVDDDRNLDDWRKHDEQKVHNDWKKQNNPRKHKGWLQHDDREENSLSEIEDFDPDRTAEIGKKLVVFNIGGSTERTIREVFEPCGRIMHIDIIKDKEVRAFY